MTKLPSVLITGASSGIGSTYADRMARRGHDLVLVARDSARMETLAAKLRQATGVAIDVLPADLTNRDDLAKVEGRLRDDEKIGILINNAGAALGGAFDQQSLDDIERLVALNTTSVLRLANVAASRFAREGAGSIINVSSVVGLVPEFGQTVYGATKAFVTFLSQGMNHELAPKGVYVQAVLPSATATEIWQRAGVDTSTMSTMMAVDEMVDAALVGFDRRETITIPPLPEAAQWDNYQAARHAMLPGFGNIHPAERYRISN